MEDNHIYGLSTRSDKKRTIPKVLWNKVNQRPSAGLKLEQVVFPKGYSGDITISIHNIESTHHNVPTDSVDFAAKVA